MTESTGHDHRQHQHHVGVGKAATQGILFRDAAAIERLRQVDTLIVDKTGTLAGSVASASVSAMRR